MINQAQLAKAMWPENPNANIKLANKISQKQGQRITPKDEQLIIDKLKQLSINIDGLKLTNASK